MNIRKFIPSPEKLGQEVLATLGAIIITALIVKHVPALRQLVKDNTDITVS